MLTSSADVFRTRQVIHDLTHVVRQHRAAIANLGTTGAERQGLEAAIDQECRLPDQDPLRLYSSLLLAAALPDEDFFAFIAATALLLANRLQRGVGEDDLYWNWGAFRDHYGLAHAPARAAVMNGFRCLVQTQILKLPDGPTEADCLTYMRQDVLAQLETSAQFELAKCVERNVSAAEAGQMWDAVAHKPLPWHTALGFRYLYERSASLAPRTPDICRLLPWP